MSSILSSPELSFVAVVLFTNSSNSISVAESEEKKKKNNIKRNAGWQEAKRKWGEKMGWQRVGHTELGEGNKRYQPTSKNLHAQHSRDSSGGGLGDPLQYLAWRNSWTEKPGGRQSIASQELDTIEETAHAHTHTQETREQGVNGPKGN